MWGVHPPRDKFWLSDTEAPGPALACCRMIPGLEISAEIPGGRWKTPPAVTPGVSRCDSRAVPSPRARFTFQKGVAPTAQGRGPPKHGDLGGFGVTHVPSSLLSLSHPTADDRRAKPTCWRAQGWWEDKAPPVSGVGAGSIPGGHSRVPRTRYRTGERSDGSSDTRIPAMLLRERHRLHHRSIPVCPEPGGGEATEQHPAQAVPRRCSVGAQPRARG